LSIKIDLLDPKVLVDFYEKFKDKPPEAVRKIAFKQGMAAGRAIVQQMNIKGKDVAAIADIVGVVLKDEPLAEIEVYDNKVRLKNEGFCPLMYVSTSLNVPWDWACRNMGWPFFHGLGAAIIPDIDLRIIKWRNKGDPYCDHVYEYKK
jgi:hypothetical protein